MVNFIYVDLTPNCNLFVLMFIFFAGTECMFFLKFKLYNILPFGLYYDFFCEVSYKADRVSLKILLLLLLQFVFLIGKYLLSTCLCLYYLEYFYPKWENWSKFKQFCFHFIILVRKKFCST